MSTVQHNAVFSLSKSLLILATIYACAGFPAAVFAHYDEKDGALLNRLVFTTPDDMYSRLGREGTAKGSVLTGPNNRCATAEQKALFEALDGLE